MIVRLHHELHTQFRKWKICPASDVMFIQLNSLGEQVRQSWIMHTAEAPKANNSKWLWKEMIMSVHSTLVRSKGWKLFTVSSRSATFTRDAETHLKLSKRKSKSAGYVVSRSEWAVSKQNLSSYAKNNKTRLRAEMWVMFTWTSHEALSIL